MLAVERHGTSGRQLVLIHGLGGPRMWEKLLPLLAGHFAVSSVHLPGFGSTPPLPRCPSSAELAAHITAALPSFGSEPVIVAGTSYGGQLAVELAARHPAVAALVLIGSSGIAPKSRLADSDAAWRAFALFVRAVALRSRPVMEWSSRRSFYDLGKRPADLVEGFRRQMARPGSRRRWVGMFRNALRRDPGFEQMLRALTAPTLIVTGAADRIVPVRAAERMHSLIPGSRLRIVEHCGHSVALEAPELLCDLIIGHAGA